ncbi:MAG: hypothetical protein KDA83_08075, partial [Planctomycetales bacterium]|nr:hypothetical protein [Planctomycetales bacterium]
MTYLRLPRNISYMRPEYLQRPELRNFVINLQQDFSQSTRLPAINDDEPLVRAMLDHFLLEADNIDEFSPYVRDSYLNSRLAEVKILAGQGDPERWATLLGPAAFQQLRERIDLEFVATNAQLFKPGEPVALELDIKNVETLIVKVFEINARNYYEQEGREVNTDISLDGLVANHERVVRYDDSPLRRLRREFTFPEIDHPGVYVIDFIGNGRSSRALVRVGRLHYTVRTSAAGQLVSIYNDADERLKDAVLWMGGREYTADEAGEIAIPFSTSPGSTPIILRHGAIATLERLEHLAESYSLTAGIHVDREALLRGRQATILVRPQLTVSGQTIPPGLLQNPKLTIVATDLDGISTTKEIQPFTLGDGEESTATIQVPPRLAMLNVTLTGTIKNLSQGSEASLSTSANVAINAIDRESAVDAVHLSRGVDGWFCEVLGKTGEPRQDRPINFTFKHRDFNATHNVVLKSNEAGRIELGALEGIDTLSVTNPEGVTQSWDLQADRATPYSVWHGIVGQSVTIPYTGSLGEPSRMELSLLERNASGYVADRFDALRIDNGMIEAVDLPAGDYELVIKHEQRSVLIRLTDGVLDGSMAIGDTRKLEVRPRTSVSIASAEVVDGKLRIKLSGSSDLTRVHVLATRYRPAFDAYGSFAAVSDGEAYWMTRPGFSNSYQSGRSIGEEYQYILDRKYATRYPGVMLERPSLLLNPWAVRTTETGSQQAAAGDDFGASPEPASAAVDGLERDRQGAGAQGDYVNLDFLADATYVTANAVVEDGELVIELPEGMPKHWLTIVANNRLSSAVHTMVLPETECDKLDLRLLDALDPTQSFVQRKQVEVLHAGDQLEMALGSSRFQSFDSFGAVFSLLTTLSGNGELAQFSFLKDWPTLEESVQHAKYSEFA